MIYKEVAFSAFLAVKLCDSSSQTEIIMNFQLRFSSFEFEFGFGRRLIEPKIIFHLILKILIFDQYLDFKNDGQKVPRLPSKYSNRNLGSIV